MTSYTLFHIYFHAYRFRRTLAASLCFDVNKILHFQQAKGFQMTQKSSHKDKIMLFKLMQLKKKNLCHS